MFSKNTVNKDTKKLSLFNSLVAMVTTSTFQIHNGG